MVSESVIDRSQSSIQMFITKFRQIWRKSAKDHYIIISLIRYNLFEGILQHFSRFGAFLKHDNMQLVWFLSFVKLGVSCCKQLPL